MPTVTITLEEYNEVKKLKDIFEKEAKTGEWVFIKSAYHGQGMFALKRDIALIELATTIEFNSERVRKANEILRENKKPEI